MTTSRPGPRRSGRGGWLRAAVLGANDGIVSTASLVLGVAAASAPAGAVATAGSAGLVAGALSMAAGEYVSVSSQRDAERADVEAERRDLVRDPAGELEELAAVYRERGLSRPLADEVARELTRRDDLGAHVRDELRLDARRRARPLQAAWASAVSFSVGAAVPLLAVLLVPGAVRAGACVAATLAVLAALGALGARLGGAPTGRATVRVVAWGAIAMAVTAGIGALVGTVT